MKIFKTDGPGLGDHLQFSTLPEKFYQEGYSFYLHRGNNFRNEEIKQLVWDLNPYVRGISDIEPNCGELKYCTGKELSGTHNYIHVIETYNNLIPTNRYPKIYYKYDRYNPENYKNRIFIDMFSTGAIVQGSFNHDNAINNLLVFIKDYLEQNKNLEAFIVENKFKTSRIELNINLPVYRVNDIFEYSELIKNCHTFITLFSGSMVLGSAIKQDLFFPKIITIDGKQHLRSNLINNSWLFDNIQYVEV